MADFVDNLTGGDTPQNAHDYGHEMSNSLQDVRSRFVATGTYELPIGKDGLILNNGGLLSSILGGWKANAIVTLQTGEPFNVTATSVSDTGGNNASYANCIGNPYTGATKSALGYAGAHSTGFFINPAAFSAPTLGTFGSCRPRSWHGPGLKDGDLSLFKSFPVVREYRIETRLEMFNAFNHPSFGSSCRKHIVLWRELRKSHQHDGGCSRDAGSCKVLFLVDEISVPPVYGNVAARNISHSI